MKHYRININGGWYSGASHFWSAAFGHSGGVCIIYSRDYAPTFSAREVIAICRRLKRLNYYNWFLEDTNPTPQLSRVLQGSGVLA